MIYICDFLCAFPLSIKLIVECKLYMIGVIEQFPERLVHSCLFICNVMLRHYNEHQQTQLWIYK
jgi:hypothetical protein